jgi:hypothetical protein
MKGDLNKFKLHLLFQKFPRTCVYLTNFLRYAKNNDGVYTQEIAFTFLSSGGPFTGEPV